MITRPIVKYFSSKWTLATTYPAPKYPIIVDTCCGGAGYACRWGAGKRVILCDSDPEVCALWRWLITEATPEGILALPCATLQRGQDLRGLGLRHEAADLIRRWQRVGRNDCWTVSSWNNTPGQWQPGVQRAIAAALPDIRGWAVFEGSYHMMPDILATWFVDPVYQSQANAFKCPPMDYAHLGQWCRERPGQVIVCEREGAEWLPFQPHRTVNAGCAHHPKKPMTEVVWVQG